MIQDQCSSLPHSSGSTTWGNSQVQCLMMKGRKKKSCISNWRIGTKDHQSAFSTPQQLLLLLRLLQTIQEKHLSPPHFQDVLLPIKFSCIPWGILNNGTQKIKDWWDTEKQYRITEKADRTAQGIKAWTSSCRLSGKVDDKHLGEKKS